MNDFMNILEIIVFDKDIPLSVKQDVSKRISDWCSAGGKETDHYITMQYEYLLRAKEFFSSNKIK